MLVSYASKNLSDPAFANLESGELRIEPKLEGEGVAVSAHIVISGEPVIANGTNHLFLLEDVPGIGRTKLRSFFAHVFKQASEHANFRFEQYGKIRTYRPTPELEGHLSQTLSDDLKEGKILGLELIKYSMNESEFDEEGYLDEKKRIIEVKAADDSDSKGLLRAITKLRQKAADEGFSDVRIRFKHQRGRQKTILMSPAREDARDALSVKSFLVETKTNINQCSKEIRDDISAQMLQKVQEIKDG